MPSEVPSTNAFCRTAPSDRRSLACGPHEGFGVGVGLGDEAVDGVFKVGDGSKHAAFEAPICELGEEAFDGIEP